MEGLYSVYNVDKMKPQLRGYFSRSPMMSQSMAALEYAFEKHEGQVRKVSDQPYIVHPMKIALDATHYQELDGDDVLFSAILLHDVVEDCGVSLNELPFSEEIKLLVKLVSLDRKENEEKAEAKHRYYINMESNPRALIIKSLDRLDNMSTMYSLGVESVRKNVRENIDYIIPMLRNAVKKSSCYYHTLWSLRNQLQRDTEIYAGVLEKIGQ